MSDKPVRAYVTPDGVVTKAEYVASLRRMAEEFDHGWPIVFRVEANLIEHCENLPKQPREYWLDDQLVAREREDLARGMAHFHKRYDWKPIHVREVL